MRLVAPLLLSLAALNAVAQQQVAASPFTSEAGLTLAAASLGEVIDREGVQAYIGAVIDGWYASKILTAAQELKIRNAYTPESITEISGVFLECKKQAHPVQLLDMAVAEAYKEPALPLAVFVHLKMESHCAKLLATE